MQVTVANTNPKLSDIEAACDQLLVVKSVQGEAPVPPVAPEAAVKAKDAVKADPKKGIKAQPAVTARGAVKERKFKPAVRAVKGGELEGGTIV